MMCLFCHRLGRTGLPCPHLCVLWDVDVVCYRCLFKMFPPVGLDSCVCVGVGWGGERGGGGWGEGFGVFVFMVLVIN